MKVIFIVVAFTGFTGSAFAQPTMNTTMKPYTINIPQTAITDLKKRIADTRWPDEVAKSNWDYGTNKGYLKELADYWQNNFDWRKQEAKINAFDQYTMNIDGYNLHFIYEKGKGKSSTPIVLLHGWPSSFVQMLKIIPLLTKPDKDGHSFDVIVPSLIGYGFSDKPTEKGVDGYKISEIFQKLMADKLGYQKFILRASDIGAGVAREWAIHHPDHVSGLHLSGSNPYIYQVPEDLSAEEKKFVEKAQAFFQKEGGYAVEQSTKPQTLAYVLNDSPVGLAGWIIEKFMAWSDNNGNLESKFSKDDLLTNISIYWFTQTIGSSMRIYYENSHTESPTAGKRVEVPTSFMMLQKDVAVAPKEWEARSYNIVRWKVHPTGGHFGEWEEPALIAEDIIEFKRGIK